MNNHPPVTYREVLLVIALILLAGILRMGWPGLTEFKADEARLMALALDFARGGDFPLRGIGSSVGFPNFPMSVWLYALPLWLSPHPFAPTLFTGLLNTLAVALTWWLARRFWGPQAAIVTLLLFAISPWAVIYSRKIWAQNLLPLFVVGWGAGALLAYIEKRPWAAVLHWVCLAVCVQLHLAAVALIPASLIMAVLFWRRIAWRWWLAGIGLAGLTAVPFAVYLFSQPVGVSIALSSASSGGGLQVDAEAWRYTVLVVLGQQIHSLAGPQLFESYLAKVAPQGVIHLAIAGLLLAGVAYLIHQSRQRPTRPSTQAGWLVLIWLLSPPLVFTVHSTPVYPHYFIAALPAAYILAGMAAKWLVERPTPRWAIPVLIFVVVAVAALQVHSWAVLLNTIGRQATPAAFGTPLRYQLQALDALAERLTLAQAESVLVGTVGDNPATDDGPAIWATLLYSRFPGLIPRFVDLRYHAVFPQQPTLAIMAESGIQADLYAIYSNHYQEIPQRMGESPLVVMVTERSHLPEPMLNPLPTPIYANGVALIGADALWEPDTLVWQLTWHTGTPDPNAVYTFFNHVQAANGTRIGQTDVALFPASQWHTEDRVLTRLVFDRQPLANQPLTIRVGLYNFPDTSPIPVLDEAANPATDAVEFSLSPP